MDISTAIYGFIHLPYEWSSFKKHESMGSVGSNNYIPLFVIIAMTFANGLGVVSVPWMLLSEVFPFK